VSLLWKEELQRAPFVGRSDVWLLSADGDIPDEETILAMEVSSWKLSFCGH